MKYTEIINRGQFPILLGTPHRVLRAVGWRNEAGSITECSMSGEPAQKAVFMIRAKRETLHAND